MGLVVPFGRRVLKIVWAVSGSIPGMGAMCWLVIVHDGLVRRGWES